MPDNALGSRAGGLPQTNNLSYGSRLKFASVSISKLLFRLDFRPIVNYRLLNGMGVQRAADSLRKLKLEL
jgi:hypothetical protein